MESNADEIKTVVIVGGVAGGASAAARLRRLDESIQIIILERSGYVSFANCGLPYHLSAIIPDREALLLQTPESLLARFRLDVRVRNEVISIDRKLRTLLVRDLATGATYEQPYDALILSPGAAPIVPPIPGADVALVLRDVEDLDRMVAGIASAHDVVVVGGGFIGLEAAENLVAAGLKVTVVELADQLLAPLDPEMANPLTDELRKNGVCVELGRSVVAITAPTETEPGHATLSDGRSLPADVVIMAIGVRPDARLATSAGLKIGTLGGITVDDTMRTSDPHIWAVGDVVEKTDIIAGSPTLTPLANIANRQGRRAADSIMGHPGRLLPSQATAIVKVFGLTAACTGWNEKRLKAANLPYLAIHTHPNDHADYYPGARPMALKLLIDPGDGAILGAQAVGVAGVDKRIDVLATAMRAGLRGPDLIDLELAYAPPFGSAKDPINQLGYICENRLTGLERSVEWSELENLRAQGWSVLDVRTTREFDKGAIAGAINIPLDVLRQRVTEIADARVVVYCAAGQRAHVAAQFLKSVGIEVVNLDGGWDTWQYAAAQVGAGV